MTTKTEITLPCLPAPGEAMSKWAYDETDMQAYARAAVEADRQGRGTILDDPVLNAIIRYGDARASMTEARCADAPYDQQVAAADDTTEAYTDLCALLSRYGNGQPDPYRENLADQAEAISMERLIDWLTAYGISTPESMESFAATFGEQVNALTLREPFPARQPAASAEPFAEITEHPYSANGELLIVPLIDLKPAHVGTKLYAAPVAQEPVAWVSKTIAYSKYISDARYRKLRPAAQRWYEPYKCASCAAPVAAQAQHDELKSVLAAARQAGWSFEKRADDITYMVPLVVGTAQAQPSAQDLEDALTQAARDVLAERRRQVGAYDWTPEHDDEHADGSLALAAASYATWDLYGLQPTDRSVPHSWPWAASWWKPSSRRRNLEKAGALILAEIERLDRAAKGE